MSGNRIDFKHSTLVAVAKYCYEGTLEAHKDQIPLEIIPHGSQATYRCCVYREREILRNRVDCACGSVTAFDGKQTYHLDEPISIIYSACEGCPLQRYTVTSNCQHCMAQKCMEACRFDAIVMTHQGAVINPEKCRECGMCAQACPYNAISDARRPCVRSCPVDAISVDKKNRRASIDYNKCISCGSCTVACPFSAISDISMITDVIDDIREGKEVFACFAPSIEGQFGGVTVGEMIRALTMLGFTDALEVALGADATAYHEAQEAKEVAREGGHMTTSCCPAFYNLVMKHFPQLKDKVSHTVSPMVAMARFVKQRHPGAKVAFIGPCIAKKSEVKRYKEAELVGADYVITYEELRAMFEAKGVDPEAVAAASVQQGSVYGKNFAVSGGVAAAVQQVLVEEQFDLPVSCLKCSGAAECKKALAMLRAGRINETIIEGMACEGGCVNGPGKVTDMRHSLGMRKQLLKDADDRSILENLEASGFTGVDMKDGR
ncbi:MAG: 4Fe-4S dicluster domain-containing protein [Clostridia bacterium]|nr:4Fe-4S dicluster domain-containing protein [Clostridia bacterium]